MRTVRSIANAWAVVFGPSRERQSAKDDLEQIVHPRIREMFANRIAEAAAAREQRRCCSMRPCFLKRAGTIYATRWCLSTCRGSERLARLRELRGWDDAETERRESSQASLETKRSRSQFAVDNSRSVDAAGRQLEEILLKSRDAKICRCNLQSNRAIRDAPLGDFLIKNRLRVPAQFGSPTALLRMLIFLHLRKTRHGKTDSTPPPPGRCAGQLRAGRSGRHRIRGIRPRNIAPDDFPATTATRKSSASDIHIAELQRLTMKDLLLSRERRRSATIRDSRSRTSSSRSSKSGRR